MVASSNGEDTVRGVPQHCQPASLRQTQFHGTALTGTRIEQAHVSSFLRTNIRQEALLSSHAFYQTQVALNDPSGRMGQRLCMLLRYSAWAEEHGFYAVPLLYSQLVSLLPRLPFLGQSLVQRILSLRRVNAAAARAGLAPSAGGASSLPLGSEHRLTYEDHGKHVLCEDIEPDWIQRRHEAHELESLVQDIQNAHSPGLGLQYSLPASLDDMASILRTHNSCFIYCLFAEDYCDVALFDRDCVESGPRTLRFPDFTLVRRNQLMARLNVACTMSRAARDDVQRKIRFVGPQRRTETVEQVLAELWTALVQPVLAGFEIQGNAGCPERRPRAWWCLPGGLAPLPLHAAGLYSGPNQDNISNYVVSSYIFCFPALYRILKQTSSATTGPDPKMLLIAYTSGDSLPYARTEADAIRRVVPPQCVLVSPTPNESPTVEDALGALPHASILHFACHGHQDPVAPFNSGFELANGRLTLAQLMRVRSPGHAQLAYLSTCESAAHDGARPEEELNLAATMLHAGFKSVIGSMWAMSDIDGPFVAERVYRTIFAKGYLDLASVPRALQDAVRDLRESGAPASRWATYVHVGG